jgi:hypothetical protein
MINVLTQVLKVLTLYATLQIKQYAHETLNRVRRFSLGTFFVMASMVFWIIGFILVFLALFFYFAGNLYLVFPGVWTALISMGAGLVITASGIWIMKKKSRQSANTTGDVYEKHLGKEFSETIICEIIKLFDNLVAGFKKQGESEGQEPKEDAKKDAQKGSSWLNVLLIFVSGFIAGVIVSSIKRKTDQSGNIPDPHVDDKPNGTDQE